MTRITPHLCTRYWPAFDARHTGEVEHQHIA